MSRRRRYQNMAHGARFGFDPSARASEIRRLRSVEGWTLCAIARAFGITKPVVHRHLSAFRDRATA
jgi:DNA-binding transcriptional regulator LsrR (DeoR family)